MKLFAIILSFGFLCAQQSPSAWWASASQAQQDFAEKCCKLGRQYNRGHTLAGIPQMESSLNADTKHDENSIGPFGISRLFIDMPIDELRDQRLRGIRGTALHRRLAEVDRRTFEGQAVLALCLFEDNIRYFKRLGYSPKEAWFWSYARYCSGKNWRRFGKRAMIFSQRVKFLKTKFK